MYNIFIEKSEGRVPFLSETTGVCNLIKREIVRFPSFRHTRSNVQVGKHEGAKVVSAYQNHARVITHAPQFSFSPESLCLVRSHRKYTRQAQFLSRRF
jgi:hypothetical protein